MLSAHPIFRTIVDPTRLAQLCEHHHIKTLRVFGSVLRPDFRPGSDIDVLLEFEPGIDPDLFELGGIQQDLSDLLGRDVDVKTPDMFSAGSLGRVMSTSVVGYAA
jgi:uncharacterized protein